jgi:CheY-like chemotaxis protein
VHRSQQRSSRPARCTLRLPPGCNVHPRVFCDADRVDPQCLIVDDNRGFLEVARTLLEREGLTIAGVASTSADALRKAQLLRPAVVLVDISLGDESGFELAQHLVADPAHDATVILISGYSEAEFVDVIATSPAAGFLSKSDLSADAIRGFLDESYRASR